jgi:hypothetical protein
MKRYLFLLLFLLAPLTAHAQGSVQQYGLVTANDFACWKQNGIIFDCGINSITIDFPTIANGHLIGNATGGSAQAQDTSLTALMDVLCGTAAQGDILYRGASSWSCLGAGTSGYFLKTQGAGANPTWALPTGTSYSAGTGLSLTSTTFSLDVPVTVARGGTGLTTGTSGGVLAFTGTTTLSSSGALTNHGVLLGGGAGAVPYSLGALGSSGQVLTSNGASADPSWQSVGSYSAGTGLDLTGTTFSLDVPVTAANGGTGLTAGTSGGVLFFSGSTTIGSSAALAANRLVIGGGAGVAPYTLSSAGTSGYVLTSNGASADPSWTAASSGTMTEVTTSSGITGGPITDTGDISCVAAAASTKGCVTPDGTVTHFLNGNGGWTVPYAPLAGTTASIGGGSVLTDACTSGTVSVTGATTAMAIVATPATYPGDGFVWKAYVSSADTVTVKVCNTTAGSLTPTASTYVVRAFN